MIGEAVLTAALAEVARRDPFSNETGLSRPRIEALWRRGGAPCRSADPPPLAPTARRARALPLVNPGAAGAQRAASCLPSPTRGACCQGISQA